MTIESVLFLLLFTLGTSLYLAWGFQNLVAERWQILASVPEGKDHGQFWHGTNFTYYGLFTANAYAAGTAIYLLLAASAGIALPVAAIVLAILLLLCAPASRLIAQWVEKKKNGFTVGGASFLGIILIPWIALLCRYVMQPTASAILPPVVAAAMIAYACGEAFGRLACISFGCCYGKPIDQAPGFLRPLFKRWHFVFTGAIKKASYEGGMEGAPLIPIQAITATVLSAIAIASLGLFLASAWKAAFLTAGIGSQAWRILSEFLRADDRGNSGAPAYHFTAYQWMSLLSIPYMLATALLLPSQTVEPVRVLNGLRTLNTPFTLLSMEFLWVVVFFYTGKSSVTGALMSFHVRKENL